jgi:hypothetical protein
MNAAKTTADLAHTAQDMGYADASAQSAAGNQQQQMAQTGLNSVNQQWERQNSYPKTQMNEWANLLASMNGGQSQNAVGYGYPQPTGMSPGAAGSMGMAAWGGNAARGGLAHYSRGGLVKKSEIPQWLAEALEDALAA